MTPNNDQAYYQRRAEQQLEIAREALDPKIRSTHLDLATRYAALRELAGHGDSEHGLEAVR